MSKEKKYNTRVSHEQCLWLKTHYPRMKWQNQISNYEFYFDFYHYNQWLTVWITKEDYDSLPQEFKDLGFPPTPIGIIIASIALAALFVFALFSL